MKTKPHSIGGWKDFQNKYGLAGVFVVIVALFSLLNPNFLTLSNWSRSLIGQAIIGSVALGAIFVLVIGEFDSAIGMLLGSLCNKKRNKQKNQDI